MVRVLMVCTGNTCRSPIAAALLQAKIREAGAESLVAVASAGLMAAAGEPMSAPAQAVLRQKGLSGQEHQAALLTRMDLASYDLILTMTTQHKRLLLSAPEAKEGRIYTLREYAGENGDISDPYGGEEKVYAACALELERLLTKAWEKIKFLAGKKQVLAKKNE